MGNIDMAELVNLYQTGFYCCMALSIISAIITVYIFIKKDIKTLFIKKTGIARRQTAKQMRMKNEQTGDLGNAAVYLEFEKTDETRSTAQLRKDTQSTGATKEYKGPAKGPAIIQELIRGMTKTGEISNKSEKTETAKIGNEANALTGSTGFTVTERIVVIHTNELIDIEV